MMLQDICAHCLKLDEEMYKSFQRIDGLKTSLSLRTYRSEDASKKRKPSCYTIIAHFSKCI